MLERTLPDMSNNYISFTRYFDKSNFQPVDVGSKVIYSNLVLPLQVGESIFIEFISQDNSKYEQGISIMPKKKKGVIQLNNSIEDRAVAIWYRTISSEQNKFEIKLIKNNTSGKTMDIFISNFWDRGGTGRFMMGPFGNSAMLIKEENGEYVCRCNDVDLDEDFSDLVFKVKVPTSVLTEIKRRRLNNYALPISAKKLKPFIIKDMKIHQEWIDKNIKK